MLRVWPSSHPCLCLVKRGLFCLLLLRSFSIAGLKIRVHDSRQSEWQSLGVGEYNLKLLDDLCQVPSFIVTLVCDFNSYMVVLGGHSGFLEEGVIWTAQGCWVQWGPFFLQLYYSVLLEDLQSVMKVELFFSGGVAELVENTVACLLPPSLGVAMWRGRPGWACYLDVFCIAAFS